MNDSSFVCTTNKLNRAWCSESDYYLLKAG
nr:MAG TPA: hypothetical protein [Caudoviricetes sp.]